MLRCSKYRLSGRDGRDVCQVAIFEEIRTSGYAKGNLHNACSGLPVGVRRGRGWCRRASRLAFINGHLADQRLAIRQMHRPWVPPTVALEAGDRSLSPLLVSHPAYFITGRAFPHRIRRGLYSVPVLCCRHPPGIRPELRLLAVFARVATQELGLRRRRG